MADQKLQPGEIYAVAVATLPPEDIDHTIYTDHGNKTVHFCLI